jgi:hypothetical protein
VIQARRSAFLLLLLLILATECQMTQSAFARTAGNAGATFAAASTTLSYAHEGKITSAYARSSFENYQSQVSGLEQQLPSQQGAPDKHTIERLLALYGNAMQAVNQPCLETSCDWRTQVQNLNRASKAFLEVSGQ